MSEIGNHTLDVSEISVQKIVAMCLFSATSLLGIVGNILVLIAVSLSRQLQTSTNIFVVALASIDLFTCLLLPVQVISLSGFGRSVAFAWVCTISAVCISTSLVLSFSILTLIAYNRFYMITKEIIYYKRLFTKRNISVTLGVIGSALTMFNIVSAVTGMTTFSYQHGVCVPDTSKSYAYPLGAGLITSLIVIVICYIKIYKHIKRHLRSVESNQVTPGAHNIPGKALQTEYPQENGLGGRPKMVDAGFAQRQLEIESKVTTNMLIVIVLFFLCMSPAVIVAFVGDGAEYVAIILAVISLNSCLNPIVYAWKHPVFRHVFKCILKRRVNHIKEPTQWARYLSETHA